MSTTQATYRTGTYYGETETLHIWEIADDQGIAAELYVSMDHLEIMQIETRSDRRGEGLARSLWDAANAQMGTIYHSLPAHRTPEGDAFAEAVGGESVTDCHVAGCYVCDCDDDNPYGY